MGDDSSTPSDPFAEPPVTPIEPATDAAAGDVAVGDLPPGVSEVFIEPDDPKQGRKGVLVGVGAALLVVAAIVVAVVVARSGTSEAYSLTAASKVAAEAKNVAFDLKVSVAGQEMAGAARIDVDRKLMAMTLDMSALADGAAIDMVMDLGSKVMYMNASALPGADQLPTDWVSMDLGSLAGGDQSLGSLANSNPLDTAKLFDKAKKVQDKGIEEVGGEKLKHYVVTVDLTAALDASPNVRQQFEQLGADLPDSIDYDVWITKENTLRRLAFTLDAAGQKVSTDMTVTGIGAIDPIVVPAADDVTDVSDMVNG